MVGHRIPSNGDVRQARRDCRSCDMWGTTLLYVRVRTKTTLHTRAHQSPCIAAASTDVAVRTPRALCCTLYNSLNVGSARCIIPCMRTTHGSSDLPPIMLDGTGGTPVNWLLPPVYVPPTPKPPPPPLAHTGGTGTGLRFIYTWTPKQPPPPLPHVTPPTKAPPPLPTPPEAQAPSLPPSSPIDSWCNHNGLGGCAPWDVTWRVTYWQWFRWDRRKHLELQLWWRYWSYRCRICHRVHHQCYEHSIWHHSKHVRPHWYRIE